MTTDVENSRIRLFKLDSSTNEARKCIADLWRKFISRNNTIFCDKVHTKLTI